MMGKLHDSSDTGFHSFVGNFLVPLESHLSFTITAAQNLCSTVFDWECLEAFWIQ